MTLFVRRDPFERFVSALVFVPRDRHNTELRLTMEAILAEAFDGTTTSFSTQLGDQPLARAHFIFQTTPGRIPPYDVRRLEERIAEETPHLDRPPAPRPGRGPRRGEGAGGAAPLRGRLPRRLPRGARRRRRAARHRLHRAGGRERRADHPPRPRRTQTAGDQARFRVFHPAPVRPLSDLLPMLEDMGLKVVWEVPYEVRPRGAGGSVWIRDFLLAADDATEIDLAGSEEHVPPGLRPRVERPARVRRLQPAGRLRRPRLARGDGAARLRPLPAPGRHRLLAGVHGGDARPQPADDEAPGRAVPAALRSRQRRPRDRRRELAGAGQGVAPVGHQPRRGPHPAALLQPGPRHRAHQLLPDRRRRRAEALPVVQARRQEGAPAAGAEAALRDLGVLAARRGAAPARRAGGARRHPLVGPQAGLPHRDPRPDEGADGQERGHRAGRRQGRLHRQALAAGAVARGVAGRGRGVLPHDDPRHARPDRQPGRRRAGAAGGRRAPRPAERPLPGGGRGQGHRHLLRHRQRAVRRVRLLARRRLRLRRLRAATTTRRWGSPRAAPGSRSSATSGSSARTSRTRTSPSSASATWPATSSATACCCPRTSQLVGAFNHLHVFVDPNPDPAVVLRRAAAAVRHAALDLGRLRGDEAVAGRRRLRAHRQVADHQPGGAGALRPRQGQRHPRRADPGDAAGAGRPAVVRRHRHLRQGVERDARRRRRPRQRRRARRRRPAPGARRRRGREPRAHPARAHRVRGARRQDQHRRDRQLRRRRHLRPRGQHQDPLRRGDGAGRHGPRGARRCCSPG